MSPVFRAGHDMMVPADRVQPDDDPLTIAWLIGRMSTFATGTTLHDTRESAIMTTILAACSGTLAE